MNASDLAYMQIATGTLDYNTAIREAVKEVAGQGIDVIHFASGHRDRLDVAMRRTVLTGVNQTVGSIQMARAEEMGTDLVQTSAHIGARNKGVGPANHEGWQGKVFSLKGGSKKYPNFEEETGYGTVTGLGGVNCRHSFYPYFEGISKNAYDKATLNEYANKSVTYNGKDMSFYDATQEQRKIEREIRKAKREAAAVDAAGLDNGAELQRVRDLQAKMREFTRQTGLKRQGVRERVIIPDRSPVTSSIDIENVTQSINALTGKNAVLEIGQMDFDLKQHYPNSLTNTTILTGERKEHILDSHPEMKDHFEILGKMLSGYVDIHRNTVDDQIAIIYLRKDEEFLFRIALWISDKTNFRNSVMSFRIARKSEYLKGLETGKSLIK